MDKIQTDRNTVILKKTGYLRYELLSETGISLSYRYPCRSDKDAIEWAKGWISSWDSLNLEIEVKE